MMKQMMLLSIMIGFIQGRPSIQSDSNSRKLQRVGHENRQELELFPIGQYLWVKYSDRDRSKIVFEMLVLYLVRRLSFGIEFGRFLRSNSDRSDIPGHPRTHAQTPFRNCVNWPHEYFCLFGFVCLNNGRAAHQGYKVCGS